MPVLFIVPGKEIRNPLHDVGGTNLQAGLYCLVVPRIDALELGARNLLYGTGRGATPCAIDNKLPTTRAGE